MMELRFLWSAMCSASVTKATGANSMKMFSTLLMPLELGSALPEHAGEGELGHVDQADAVKGGQVDDLQRGAAGGIADEGQHQTHGVGGQDADDERDHLHALGALDRRPDGDEEGEQAQQDAARGCSCPLAVLFRLFTALPHRDRPISATVGPMTTGGSSLLTQPEPVFLMISAMTA